MRSTCLSLLALSIILFFENHDAAASVFGADVPTACLVGTKDRRDPPDAAIAMTGGRLSTVYPNAGSTVIGGRPAGYEIRRVACGGQRAALLLSISDQFAYTNPSNLLFPRLYARRAGVRHELHAVNLAGERILSGTPGRIQIGFYNNFVISADSPDVELISAFDLVIEDWPRLNPDLVAQIPAYAPTPQTYPEAFGARPINGRYAGNFFDPAKPGEGIVVEIGDVAGQEDMHFLQFAWHSFDNNGAPFWISGGETFRGRPQRLHMPAAYRSGGRFGGSKPADSQTAWGTVDIEFSSCQTAVLRYAANSGLPAQIPSGSGELEWHRLTGVSGYSCE